MNEPLEWRNARILDRAVPGTMGGRLETAQPVPGRPSPSRQTTPGRGHSLVIAASDATDAEKRGADIVCDGTDDDAQLNAALLAVGDGVTTFGGQVRCTSGVFVCADTLILPDWVCIVGQGIEATGFSFPDGVDGFEGGIASHLRDFYAYTEAGSLSIGIKSRDDAFLGVIERVYFADFDTAIHLYYRRWLVSACHFYASAGGWAIKLDAAATGTRVLVNCGEPNLDFLYDDAVSGTLVVGNEAYGAVGYQSGPSNTAGRVVANELTGDVILDGASANVHDNGCNDVTANGDHNSIQANDISGAVVIAATADSTLLVMNRIAGSITDSGTNTKRNLDGTAADWNL